MSLISKTHYNIILLSGKKTDFVSSWKNDDVWTISDFFLSHFFEGKFSPFLLFDFEEVLQ